MNKIYLIRHSVPLALDYNGFTVKPGAWYGVVKTPFGTVPAAWSGWTCEGCIYLYTLTATGWVAKWCDETLFGEEYVVEILGDPDDAWLGEDAREIPFFAR